jgi:hypothetical protein
MKKLVIYRGKYFAPAISYPALPAAVERYSLSSTRSDAMSRPFTGVKHLCAVGRGCNNCGANDQFCKKAKAKQPSRADLAAMVQRYHRQRADGLMDAAEAQSMSFGIEDVCQSAQQADIARVRECALKFGLTWQAAQEKLGLQLIHL